MAEGTKSKQIENEVKTQVTSAMHDVKASIQLMMDAIEAWLSNRLPHNRKE